MSSATKSHLSRYTAASRSLLLSQDRCKSKQVFRWRLRILVSLTKNDTREKRPLRAVQTIVFVVSDRAWLRKCFVGRKCLIERTKQSLDGYFCCRAVVHEFFGVRDPFGEDVQTAMRKTLVFRRTFRLVFRQRRRPSRDFRPSSHEAIPRRRGGCQSIVDLSCLVGYQ